MLSGRLWVKLLLRTNLDISLSLWSFQDEALENTGLVLVEFLSMFNEIVFCLTGAFGGILTCLLGNVTGLIFDDFSCTKQETRLGNVSVRSTLLILLGMAGIYKKNQ